MKLNRLCHQRCHKEPLWLLFFLVFPFYATFAAENSADEVIHHNIIVKLHPVKANISVTDSVQFPAGTVTARFSLRNSLTVKVINAELALLSESDDTGLRHYKLNRLPADGKVQLSYQGRIVSRRTSGPFDMPESVFDKDNLYLDASSAWLPKFEQHPLFTFNMQVKAPQNWQVISQGKRGNKDNNTDGVYRFNMPRPQDDIYLLAGPYQRYAKQHDGIELVVYLYEADTALAEKYLQASAEYISLYSDWIGRYPYASFAVVENRWQTGYGMPSFTLLGSRVIRLPFILNTSLPHEILHNWWGNGVYIDFSKGNWSEGLTAYMSDHYSNEQQGKGREYRRKALERYANFAAEQADFALSDFSSRHDEASQAIGYSKALMVFHMIRRQFGDETFNNNLRQFWLRYQFKYANFYDLIRQLYSSDIKDIDKKRRHFIEQWLNRTGAPAISLDNVSVDKLENSYLLTVKISQQQPGSAYRLQIPLDVTLQNNTKHREKIFLTGKQQLFTFEYQQQPVAVTLDPDYDVFRLLHANERPASLGRLFGAKKQLLVLPSNATPEQLEAWQGLAASWSGRYKNVEIAIDNEIKSLPENVSLWLLGWNNKHLEQQRQRFTSSLQQLSAETASINRQQLHADKHAVVMLDADNSRTALAFIGADDPKVITSLARKLPHYSSYGALAFELPAVNNIIKQHLPVLNSPMSWKAD